METQVIRFDPSVGHYVFREAGLTATSHSHPHLEVIRAETGTFQVAAPSAAPLPLTSFVVAPNLPHTLESPSATCLIEMFDVERLVPEASDEEDVDALLHRLHHVAEDLPADQRRVVLESAERCGSKDPRVGAILRQLRGAPISATPNISALARSVNLSASRLSHLFSDAVGLPIRRYLVYRRLRAAVVIQQNGDLSLTEAAHAADFTDLAHFSRQFRAVFGVNPSVPYRRSASVQADDRTPS